MQFNNQSFESNAAKTLSTISKLKAALNFTGASQGLDQIEKSANEIKFDRLASSIESIEQKFSLLHSVAVAQFNKIVDKAITAGANIAKAFTLEPITSGFNEYELKLGSIQTILANTISRQKTVSQQAIQEINDAAEAAVEANQKLNEQAIENLQESQAAQTKALQKSFQAQNKAFEKQASEQTKAFEKQASQKLQAFEEETQKEVDALNKSYETRYNNLDKAETKELNRVNQTYQAKYEKLVTAQAKETALLEQTYEAQTKAYEIEIKNQTKVLEDGFDQETEALEKSADAQLDALEDQHSAELKALEKSNDAAVDALQDRYDEQLDALEDYYDEAYEALEKSQEQESKLLQQEHDSKLDMYEEEYMAKLKVADEARYNELKAIDDQIDSIKGLAKAEKEEAKEAENRRRLQELEAAVSDADTETEKLRAERKLADFKAKLAEEQAEKEREQQIDALEQQKEAINDAYELKKEQIKEEYEQQKANEADLYEQQKDNLKDIQKAEKKALQEQQKDEKKALQDQKEDELDVLKEQQSEAKELLKKQQEDQKEALKETQKVQKKALKEQQELQKEALKEQQKLQKETIDATYENQKAALAKQQELQRQSLENQNANEIAAITKSYEARRTKLQEQQTRELNALSEKRAKEQEALEERIDDEREALNDRIDKQREAIKDRQDAESDALSKRQKAELKAMQESHKQALANIETEKNAKIAAMQAEAGMTKASTLEDVNKALDELNEYADKTIYNFADMTRNIGTFTAAGVDLQTSVDAIKGIANLAALSGSNAQQASTAMYQLSQAIAGGTLKLEDWNSVQTAGMGGKTFQESLKETARVHGIAVDEMIAKYGSFEYSLQSGWLTSEVLLETLSKFTGDLTRDQLKSLGYTEEQIDNIVNIAETAVDAATKVRTFSQLIDTTKEAIGSGWTETFEIIFGNFDEATELWTGVSDIIGEVIEKQADARNQLLTGWKEGGGREDLIQSVKNVWDALVSIMDPIKKAFADIFPPLTSKHLIEISESVKNLTAKFKLSEETTAKVRKIFSGLFAIVKSGAEIFSAFFKAISPITNLLGKLAGKLVTWTANFGEYITKLSKSATENKTFAKTAETIRSTLEKVFDAIGKAVDVLSKPFEFLRDVAVEVFGKITAKAEEVEEPIDKASEKFKKAQTTISGFIDTVKNWFSTTFGSIDTGFLDNFSEKFTKFRDDLTEKYGGIEGIADALIAKAKELGSKVSEWFGKAKEGVSSFIDSISEFKEGKFTDLINWLGEEATTAFNNLRDAIVSFVKTNLGTLDLGFLNDVYNTIKSAIDPSKSFLDNFKSVYEAFKTKLSEWAPIVVDALKNTGKALSDLAASAGGKLVDGFKEITDFFGNIVSGAGNALESIKKLWEDIKKFASEHIKAPDLSFITDLFGGPDVITHTSTRSQGGGNYEDIQEGLITVETDLDTFSSRVSKIAASIKEKFANIVEDMTLDEILSAIDKISVALVALAAAGFIRSLKKLTNTISETIGSVKDIFESIKDVFVGIKDTIENVGNAIKDAIGNVGDTIKEFQNSIKIQQITQIGKVILMLAVSVAILAKSVMELASLKLEQLLPAAGVIAAFIAELTGAMFLLTKYGGDAKISALALLAFAEALKIVSDAVVKLGEMDLVSLAKGTVSAITALAALGGASWLVGKGGFNANAGLGLMEMAASLLIVQKAVKDFGQLKPSVLIKGGVAAAAAIAALAGASALVGVSGFNASAGAGIIAFSAALLVMQKALEVFGTMSLAEIGRGFVGLVAGLVPLVTAVRSASGTLQGSAALTVASVALIAIGKAMQMLEGIGLGQILSDLVLFAGILTGLTVAAYALSPVTPTLVALGLAIAGVGVAATGIALAMSAFVASLGVLATTSEVALTAVVVAFGLLARGVLEVIEQLAPAIGDAFKAIILAMCDVVLECAPQVVETVMQVIEQILYSLVDHVPTIVDTIAQLIVQVIDSLTMHVPEIVMSAVQLIETILAAVFEAIKTSGMEVLMDAIMALILLEGLMNKMAALEKVGIQAMKGVLEAGAVIVELGVLLAAIGALAQIPGLTWLLGEGIEVLRLVGSAIGQFIGAIVGGILNGFSSQLPAIAENLSNFMDKFKVFLAKAATITTEERDGVILLLEIITLLTAATIIDAIGQIFAIGTGFVTIGNHLTGFGKSMKPFLKVANTVKESAMLGVKYLAETLLIITQQGIIDGLTKWFTGGNSLAKFGEDLEAFGPHLAKFAKDTAKIKGDQIEGTANALKILAEAAEVVPNSGGVLADIFGDNDLGNFGEQLEKLGPHLAQFAKDTAKVNASSVEGSASAIKILSEAADNVPNTGGKVAEWIGDNTLDEFGRQLALFGPSLKTYATAIDGIDVDQVKASANAMTILARAATTVPNSGGKLAEWIGDNKLDDFGTQLEGFGDSLKAYADAIDGVSIKKVEASARASMMLTDLANSVPTSGGLLQTFFGEKNLETFGGQLKEFGGYLKDYNDAIDGISPEDITASASAAGSLAALANNLPEEKGIFAKLFTGDNSLANFGSNLESFGGHLKKYADSVSGMDTSGSTQASTIATTMVNIAILLQNITLKNIKTFGSNVKSFGENLKSYYNSIKDVDQDKFNTSITNINSIISIADDLKTFENSTFTGFADALQTMADSGISAFADAFDTGYDDCKESINKFIAAVSKGITDKKTSLETPSKTLGESVPSAIVTGMNSKGPDLNTAIQTICTAITNTFKNDLKTSDYKTIGEGMTNGIKAGISSPGQQILSTIKILCDGLTSKFKTCLPSSTFQTIGSNIVTGIKNGLNNRAALSNLTSAISLLSSNIVKAFSSYLTAEKTKSYGVNVVNGITAGLNGGKVYVESAARNLAGWINNALSTNLSYNTSRNSAVNFVNGLINGLNGGQSYVVDAAKRVASGVVKVVNTLWNEHSPSKVAEEQGAYYDEGLSLGIKKNANSVYNSIGNVAEEAEAIIEVVGEDIGDAMILAGDGSSEAAASIIDDTETVGESLDDLNSHISNYVDDSVSSYDEWQNSFAESSSNIQNGLYETGDAMDDATAKTNEFTDSVNDAEPEVTNLTELMQKAVRVCDDFKIAISNLIETIKSLMQGINALTDSVGNDKLKVDELTDSFGFITDKISGLTDSLSPLASAIENVAMAFDGMASSAVNSTGELNRYGDTYSDVSSTLGSNSDYLTSGSQGTTGASSGSGSSGYGLYSGTVDDLSSTIDDSITDAMREQKVDLTVDLTKGTVKNNNSGKTAKATVKETESEKKETTTKKKTTTKQKEVLSEHNESGKKQTEYGFAQSSVKNIASMIDFSTTSALLQSTATELANTQKATQAAQEENDRVTQELLKTIQTQAANNNTSNIENTNVFYISSTDPQESAQEVGRVLQKQVERSKAVWAL